MNSKINEPDHDVVVSLLPWYVNRTLDESQRPAVSSHIENCSECQSEIQFLTTLMATVQTDAQSGHSEHADVDTSFASVMNRIDDPCQQGNSVKPGLSWLRQILHSVQEYFSAQPFPHWGAAAVACFLVSVLGLQLYNNQPDGDYSVLSSSDIVESSMRLSVKVNAGVGADQIQSVIQSQMQGREQQIDVETDNDHGYIIVFKEAVGVSELSSLVTELERDPQIDSVEILTTRQ